MISSLNPINIIIVDDSLSNLAILKEVLERPGVNIISSNVPTEVLEICIAQEISIALIDVKMPVMSGFELLTQLKSNPLTENIVVILMTGHSMSTDEVFLGLSSGAVDYLFKPLDLHITNAKVNSLLTLINYQRDIQQKNKELEEFQHDLYQAVEEAKKGKSIKENFLANMSHEIRTPLNAIVGITNLLKGSELNAMQQKMLQLMDFSSTALLGIVNDVLESFQIDAGKVTLHPVNTDIAMLFAIVGETMQPLAIEKGLMLSYDIIGEVPHSLVVDPLRLKQILMNLINNAIKFTTTGKIEITLEPLSVSRTQAELAFTIKDTGLGIPEEAINQIFERFEQVEDKTWQQFGGTGLGLSIVKRLSELMGGKIDVKSVLDEGTTFTFTASFDLSSKVVEEPQNSVTTSLAALEHFDNVRILLAEDNAINQFVAVRILQSWNINVDVALNGLEAFHKVAADDFDLVLMDTHMPVMNGMEATRKIRTELVGDKKQIPIISFSASVIEHERQEALDAGVNDFLEKPFNPQILHDKILKVIRSKQEAATDLPV
jgi:signal transduction histidine kinase/AmiR/NasT family two-component response regulator